MYYDGKNETNEYKIKIKSNKKNSPLRFRYQNSTKNAWSIRTIVVCSWSAWIVFYFATFWSSSHFCICHTDAPTNSNCCWAEAFPSSSWSVNKLIRISMTRMTAIRCRKYEINVSKLSCFVRLLIRNIFNGFHSYTVLN